MPSVSLKVKNINLFLFVFFWLHLICSVKMCFHEFILSQQNSLFFKIPVYQIPEHINDQFFLDVSWFSCRKYLLWIHFSVKMALVFPSQDILSPTFSFPSGKISVILAWNNSELISPVFHTPGCKIPSFPIPHAALRPDGDCLRGGFVLCNNFAISPFLY